MNTESLTAVVESKELLEVARKAIEDVLVTWRDNRWSQPFAGNGLVIREANGSDSHIIRMTPDSAVRIGLRAIVRHLEES